MDKISDLWEFNKKITFGPKRRSSFTFYFFNLHNTMPTVLKKTNPEQKQDKLLIPLVYIMQSLQLNLFDLNWAKERVDQTRDTTEVKLKNKYIHIRTP